MKENIQNFELISKKYPPGHQHYKQNLKKLKLKIRGICIKLEITKKTEILKELNNFLSIFLSKEKPSKGDCEELIGDIDRKIQDIELNIEQNFLEERIYDKGSRFDFHIDIKDIIKATKRELFIIEPYVEDHLLEITLKGADNSLNIRVITNSNNMKFSGNFIKLGRMFKGQQKGTFEVRESLYIHDRGIFIDSNEGWVMGQSIKDGAKNKPTYLIKLRNPNKLREIYEGMWKSSKKIV